MSYVEMPDYEGTPPQRGQQRPAFNTNMEYAFQYFSNLPSNMNASGASIELLADEAFSSKTLAEAAAAISLASSNFKGFWDTLTGALNIPASVYWDGSYWMLLQNLADITTQEPGSAPDYWVSVFDSGFINPMTTAGDIIVGGTSGVPTKLPKLSSGAILAGDGSGNPNWYLQSDTRFDFGRWGRARVISINLSTDPTFNIDVDNVGGVNGIRLGASHWVDSATNQGTHPAWVGNTTTFYRIDDYLVANSTTSERGTRYQIATPYLGTEGARNAAYQQIRYKTHGADASSATWGPWKRHVYGEQIPLKIAVIGDSLTAQHAGMDDSVVTRLEAKLNGYGVNSRVIGCGRDAHTFYRANTTEYIDGKTSVEHAIELQPDVVLVALGLNDALNAVDGRNNSQIIADATTLFSTLNSALPSATIIYVRELAYDVANFPTPGTTLKNKGTLGWFMQLKTSGYLTGFRCDEILEDSTGSTTRTRFGNWVTIDSAISLLGTIDGTITMDLFKVHKLGGGLPDCLHLSGAGSILCAAAIVDGLQSFAPFDDLFDNNYGVWEKLDDIFDAAYSTSGDGYSYAPSATFNDLNRNLGNALHPNIHHLGYPCGISATSNVDGTPDTYFEWTIYGAAPNAGIYLSNNEGSFSSLGVSTDGSGYASSRINGQSALATLGTGTRELRYRFGSVVLPEQTCTVGNATLGWTAPSFGSGWTNYDGATPVGYYKDSYGRVHLRGMIKRTSGSVATAFTLPSGFRPTTLRYFGTIGALEPAVIEIQTDGDVIPAGSDTAKSTGIALDGMYFDTRS